MNNDAFEKNSWHFRNALIKANFNDLQNGVHATTKFLVEWMERDTVSGK